MLDVVYGDGLGRIVHHGKVYAVERQGGVIATPARVKIALRYRRKPTLARFRHLARFVALLRIGYATCFSPCGGALAM